jgi:threonine dehydrogenase-like Zn-dependent dehydrogenase
VGERVTGTVVGERVVINPNLECGVCRFCRMERPNLCDELKSRHEKSNGGLADYVALDYRMVHPLPNDLPDELATFVEPLSCALHIVDVANLQAGERIAVFGGGSMGYLAGVALHSNGVDAVFVEPVEERRQRLSEAFGFQALAPAGVDTLQWAETVDVAIDCSGSVRALSQAIRVLRKGGRLVMSSLALESQDVTCALSEVTVKELEITGAWLNPGTFGPAIELTRSSRELLTLLPTEVLPLAEIRTAFDRAGSPLAPKILVRP